MGASVWLYVSKFAKKKHSWMDLHQIFTVGGFALI